MKRTGRASEAVSKAIRGLVRKQLLEVHSDAGADMSSPQARRRNCGKLWYQLPDYVLGDNFEHKPNSVLRIRKSNTTKETFNKIYNVSDSGFANKEQTSEPNLDGWYKASDVFRPRT
jgi:hypothetical protein